MYKGLSNLLITAATVTAMTLGSVGPTHATTVNVTDGSWWSFDVDDFAAQSGGTEWIDAQSNLPRGYLNDGSALTLHFTTTSAKLLKVVDGGLSGDQFQVFDNGVGLGLTTAATAGASVSGVNQFDTAYNDPRFSKGLFVLAAGTHNITGLLNSTTQSFNATVGALQVAEVPVPAAVWLLGSGIVSLVGFARRKHS